jgi:hypothetical protein
LKALMTCAGESSKLTPLLAELSSVATV